MEDRIRKRLEDIRSYLRADGGDLEIVSINGFDVQLKLLGACGGCPHAMITLKEGIESDLREQIDSRIVVNRVE